VNHVRLDQLEPESGSILEAGLSLHRLESVEVLATLSRRIDASVFERGIEGDGPALASWYDRVSAPVAQLDSTGLLREGALIQRPDSRPKTHDCGTP
jgi:hypothetical protein